MDRPEFYEIRVENRLPRDMWSYWFEGLTADEEPNGTTVLHGQIVDQAALHGVLRRLHDLNLKLILVKRVEPEQRPRDKVAGP
jgi:hypothetical protein